MPVVPPTGRRSGCLWDCPTPAAHGLSLCLTGLRLPHAWIFANSLRTCVHPTGISPRVHGHDPDRQCINGTRWSAVGITQRLQCLLGAWGQRSPFQSLSSGRQFHLHQSQRTCCTSLQILVNPVSPALPALSSGCIVGALSADSQQTIHQPSAKSWKIVGQAWTCGCSLPSVA